MCTAQKHRIAHAIYERVMLLVPLRKKITQLQNGTVSHEVVLEVTQGRIINAMLSASVTFMYFVALMACLE